jgi:hypothetical protein
MINKKLFETVIGFEVVEFEQNINTIRYYPASYPRAKCIDWKPDLISINIYELAHKCKEWAKNLEYDLYSSCNGICALSFGEYRGVWNNFPTAEFYVKDNELESIFEACEFIIDNKKGVKND